jgi:AraC-like DNA-binding protein
MPKDSDNTTDLTPSSVAYTLDPSRPVLTHSRSMEAETSMVPHAHPRGQLLWAASGILKVTSDKAVWVVPCSHAVWIPGGIYHQVSSETITQLRNLYIDPSFTVRKGETTISMLKMTPLMQQLVLKLTENANQLSRQRTERLGRVAIDEITSLQAFKLYIPAGKDPRLKRLITYLVNNPSQNETLQTLSAQVGASVRTIERLFKAETGMTFRQWRSRFRLLSSLNSIANGETTSKTAFELGYKSTSSFIAAFKALFGCTPQEYNQR